MLPKALTHTHTQACCPKHVPVHTLTQTHTHTSMLPKACTHTHTLTLTLTHKYTPQHSHTRTHACTHIIHTHACAHVRKLTHTVLQTDWCTCCMHDLPQIDWDTWYYASGFPPVTHAYDTAMAEQAYALASKWHTADVMGIGSE